MFEHKKSRGENGSPFFTCFYPQAANLCSLTNWHPDFLEHPEPSYKSYFIISLFPIFQYRKNGTTSAKAARFNSHGTMEEETKVCPTALMQVTWPAWPLPVPSRTGLGRPGERFHSSRLPGAERSWLWMDGEDDGRWDQHQNELFLDAKLDIG